MTGAAEAQATPADPPPARTGPGAAARVRRALAVGWDAGGRFQVNEGFVLAGYIAFAALLAVFPFAIFVASLAAATTGPEEIEALSDFLFEALPPQVATAIGPPLTSALSLEGRSVLTVSALGAVWAASNGVEAFRISFDRAYGADKPRHFVLRRLIGMLAVVVGAAAAALMGVAVVFAPLILRLVEGLFGIEAPLGLGLARYGVALLAFVILLRLMHWSLPAARPLRLWPGIWATVAIWAAAATAFSAYLAIAPSYSVTYGALSGVIVTLLFFYLSGAVIIYGAEVNAALDRRTQHDAARASAPGAQAQAGSETPPPPAAAATPPRPAAAETPTD